MPRPADQIFLRLAVQRGYLTREQAEAVQLELRQRADRGDATKARHLCVQVGMLTPDLARTIKHDVRAYLERKASQESRPQRRIAGFEIESRLGCGAMGVVFKARHVGLNKTVALKLLNPEFANDPKYVARFLQEARAAARLQHPGIVQAYDVGQAEDVHFIAMEFVRGKTVKELIERRERLSEAAAIEIVLQVLDALRHAHEQSVIHRDVKPANLMITREGQAKLLDLGLARQTDVENGLTGEGRAIGTPYYMAPEQALDKGADYRADLYSLGVTLFNMVTGRKPYEGSTPVAVMNMHIKGAIPDVRNHVPELSEGLSRLIAKLMAKRPADRYQDHALLEADLQAVLAGAVPSLETGKTPEGIDYIKPRTPTAAQVAAPSRPRLRAPWFIAAAAAGVLAGGGLIAFLTSGGAPEAQVAVGASAQDKLAERDAKSMLQDLERIGSTGRSRAEALQAIAARYPQTQAAEVARAEAQELLAQLDGADVQRFNTQQERLEALAAQGKLLDARRGFQALAGSFEGVELAEKARGRADELQGTIQQQVAELEQQALNLTRHGDLSGAARVLERSLALRDPAERAKVRERISALDERVAAGGEGGVAEEAVAIANLPKRLRGLVREGRPADALTLARELLATTREPTLHERVAGHVEALQAVLNEPESARGVAALKLYRGDRDAAEALSRVRPLGSLAGVSVELEGLERGGARTVQAMHRSNAALAVTTYASAARDEHVAEHLPRLFPAASSTRFLAGAVALTYEFYPGSGLDHDWRVVDGQAVAEESGLALRGEGRAEFDAPLEGEISASLRFSALSSEGRLALTLDAGDQRFSCDLGQLRHLRGGDLRQETGRSVQERLSDTRSHLLELVREGAQLISRFDGEEVARLDLPQSLGALRLGLEWEDADIGLETLEVRGVPNHEWVERQLR